MYKSDVKPRLCERCKEYKLDVLELPETSAGEGTVWRLFCRDCRKIRNELGQKLNPPKPRPARTTWLYSHKVSYYRLQLSRSQVMNANRAAQKYGVLSTVGLDDWFWALDYFHGVCAVCGNQGKDLFDDKAISLDHWIPLSRGGTNTPENIIPLCYGLDGCNNKKHDIMPQVFLERTYGKRKAKKILARIETFFTTVRNTKQHNPQEQAS